MINLHQKKQFGFSLLETMFSMLIMLMMGLGVISGIVYTRQSMELDKQQLAALSYARRTMEEAQNTTSMLNAEEMTLVPFNAPGLEIKASVDVNFFKIKPDGTVDPTPLKSVDPRTLTLCRVTVKWTPAGRWSKERTVSVQSLVVGTTL